MTSEQKFSFVENIGLQIIKCGPIPKHISLIMDGNRTYSKKYKIPLSEAYEMMFNKAIEVLDWSLAFGIEQISVYTFSIENFKRSAEQVENVMKAARDKITIWLKDDTFVQKGVRVIFIGKLSLLKNDLYELMMKLMETTKDGKIATFYFMFAYAFRDEITHSIMSNVEDVLQNKIGVEEITEERIIERLYLSEVVDMFIRTSGVNRLSDFLPWQLTSSSLIWVSKPWIQFRFWNLIAALFSYQRNYTKLMGIRKCLTET